MDYLHYYFSNYIKENQQDLSYINRGKRVELILRQMDLFGAKVNQFYNSAATNELGEVMDILSGEGHAAALEDVYVGASHTSPQINGVDISSIANMKVENIAQKLQTDANDLTTLINDFYNSLTQKLDEVYQILGKGEAYDTFAANILTEYCNDNEIPKSQAGQVILRQFLSSEGLSSVKGRTNLETYIKRLSLLASSLPSYTGGEIAYGTTRGKEKVAQSLPEFFKIVAQKTNGLFSNITGRIGEMAFAKAEEEVSCEIQEKLHDVNISIDNAMGLGSSQGNSWLDCDVNVDGAFEIPDQPTVLQTNTGDVQVTVTKGQVSASYGVNVKDYKFDSRAKFQKIRIGTNLSFLDAYHKVYGNDNFLYAVASGQAGVTDENADIYSESMITALWQDLIATTVAGSVLDTLAGMPQEDNLFLSVNGRIFTLIDVIQQVGQSIMGAESDMLVSGTVMGISQKNRLTEKNIWSGPKGIRSSFYAEQRSDTAGPAVANALSTAKLNINLKMLSALLR